MKRLPCWPAFRSLVLSVLAAGGASSLGAVDFLRGDVNNDGVLSIADGYQLSLFLFGGGELTCREAADVDGNSEPEITDLIHLLRYIFLKGDPPVAPFPAIGPDTIPPDIGCTSYGGEAPMPDPRAKLQVLDIEIPGGASGHGFITLRLSAPQNLVAFAATLADDAGIIDSGPRIAPDGTVWAGDYSTMTTDFSGLSEFLAVRGSEGKLILGYLTTIAAAKSIPAGEDIKVLEIPFCLKPGTRAGSYPLSFTAGEVVYSGSGRSVVPGMASGTITVLDEVTASECLPTPRTDVEFKLAEGTINPGGTATLPLSVRTNRGSQGIQFSIEYDGDLLEATGVEMAWERPDGLPYELAIYDISPGPIVRADGTVGDSMVGGFFLIDDFLIDDQQVFLPIDREVPLLELSFHVKPEATAGVTEIRFQSGAPAVKRSDRQDSTVCTDPPRTSCFSFREYENYLVSGFRFISPEVASSFLFVNASLRITGDISIFRGDANGDRQVDLSDAVFILSYLFLGESGPACEDQADANDDGRIDVSDPIAILQELFILPNTIAAPYPRIEPDPTEDSLDCSLSP